MKFSEEQVPIDDLPTSKPVVSPTFWDDEFFDDLELKMKMRYLKGQTQIGTFMFDMFLHCPIEPPFQDVVYV